MHEVNQSDGYQGSYKHSDDNCCSLVVNPEGDGFEQFYDHPSEKESISSLFQSCSQRQCRPVADIDPYNYNSHYECTCSSHPVIDEPAEKINYFS